MIQQVFVQFSGTFIALCAFAVVMHSYETYLESKKNEKK